MMEFITLTLLMILAIISPGPDFIIVTKNSLNYSRIAGIYTALGVSFGAMLLAAISVLGLVIVIMKSVMLFNILKFAGAIYLIYLGFKTFFIVSKLNASSASNNINSSALISNLEAFKQGFLCATLNPKAMLFFTALFTTIFELHILYLLKIAYAVEVTFLYFIWFVLLSYLITQPTIRLALDKVQFYINKILGVFLILLGIHVMMIPRFA
jgi:RhtB (resistance to homoserine/threonine) family protein